MNKKLIWVGIITAITFPHYVLADSGITLEDLSAKLEALVKENAMLRNRVDQLETNNK